MKFFWDICFCLFVVAFAFIVSFFSFFYFRLKYIRCDSMTARKVALYSCLYDEYKVNYENIRCINTLCSLDKCALQRHRLILVLHTFFYHINQQLHLKICNQHELETLFITLIKYLIYETMAFQVLVSTNH